MKRTNLTTGAPWEEEVGYCRAVKIGNVIEVSGTVAVDNNGEIIGENDPYIQAKFILLKIQNSIEQLGAKLEDVIRTRMYVTNIKDWEKIGKAHSELFKIIKPCTTMVEVSALIDPRYLVEIEATVAIN